MIEVELCHLGGSEAGGEPEGEDASGRGAGQELGPVEESRLLLQAIEDARREDAAHAPAVDREDVVRRHDLTFARHPRGPCASIAPTACRWFRRWTPLPSSLLPRPGTSLACRAASPAPAASRSAPCRPSGRRRAADRSPPPPRHARA